MSETAKPRVVEFTHKGKSYEVRVTRDGENIYVKPCHGARQVAVGFSLTDELVADIRRTFGRDAVQDAVEMAKESIVKGWEGIWGSSTR
jgi:hypothetical protein